MVVHYQFCTAHGKKKYLREDFTVFSDWKNLKQKYLML